MANKDATTAYRTARERVDRQIAQIQALLQRHASKQTAAPANWGYAGDVNHVVEILNDALEFLGGKREETRS